jgi:hypothetical protein
VVKARQVCTELAVPFEVLWKGRIRVNCGGQSCRDWIASIAHTRWFRTLKRRTCVGALRGCPEDDFWMPRRREKVSSYSVYFPPMLFSIQDELVPDGSGTIHIEFVGKSDFLCFRQSYLLDTWLTDQGGH